MFYLNNPIDRMFFNHPRNEQLTYFSHLRRSWTFSFQFLEVSIKAFIHGLCPALFDKCVSDMLAPEIELTK